MRASCIRQTTPCPVLAQVQTKHSINRRHPQLLLQNSSPQLSVPDSSDERAKATPSKYGTTATASETELFQPRRALAQGARKTRRTRESEIGKAHHRVHLAEGDGARTPAVPLDWTEGTSEGTVAEDVGAGIEGTRDGAASEGSVAARPYPRHQRRRRRTSRRILRTIRRYSRRRWGTRRCTSRSGRMLRSRRLRRRSHLREFRPRCL